MAHIPLFASALAAGMMVVTSPFTSVTRAEDRLVEPVTQSPTISQTPAMSANMLDLSMCGEREQVVSELRSQFKEKPMAVGQVDNNAVVEILVSETGSWTILATGTDGTSCIVSAGEGFQSTTLVRGVDA
jgi:hypothetical protein